MTAEEYINASLKEALKDIETAQKEVLKGIKQKQPATEIKTDLRTQAAIAALQGYCANPHELFVMMDIKQKAELSVKQADELIKALG